MSKVLTVVGIGLAIIFTAGAAAGGIAAAFAAGGFTGAFASLGLGLVISGLSQLLVPKPSSPRPRYDVNYDGTVERRRIWYGELVAGGMETIGPWTSGANNKYLHEIITLAAHRMDAITEVIADKVVIPASDIGPITGTNADGIVGGSSQYADHLWLRRKVGSGGQTADYIMMQAFPTRWTSSHRGLGIAHLLIRMELDEKAYRGSKPQFRVRGRGKRCYDPRLDVSPGANVGTAAYMAYTNNAMLVAVDYFIDDELGCAVPSARIDWDLVVIGANICDEDVLIPPASPVTTQKRYTSNGLILVAENDDERRENLEILLSACLGHMYYRGGKYRFFAGAAQTETFTLNDDNVHERIAVDTALPAHRLYNYVTGQFIDADHDFLATPFETRSDASYETEDLGRFPQEINLPFCTNQYEAQRNAIVILKRSRCQIEIRGTWDMGAYKVRPGDVGRITLTEWHINNLLVKCSAWKPLNDWLFEATFIEEISTAWADPSVSDYTAVSISDRPSVVDITPDPIESFTVVRRVDSIHFHWNWQDGWPIGGATRFYIYEAVKGAAFGTAVKVSPNINATSYDLPKTDAIERDYFMTVQNFYTGEESAPSGPVTAAALALTAGFHLQISHSTMVTKVRGASTANSQVVTVTPVNGTLPITYSWAKVSGPSTTTANSPSAAATSFNNTSMVDEDIDTSVWECTAVDGASNTAKISTTQTFWRQDNPYV